MKRRRLAGSLLAALAAGCAAIGSSSAAGPAPAVGASAAMPVRPAPLCLTPAGAAPVPDPNTDAALQAARQAPLLALVARSGLISCRVVKDDSSVEMIYRARDRSTFRFRGDSAIESNEFEARFTTPPDVDPRRVLMQSEAQAFGAGGCGIDWSGPGEAGPDGGGAGRTTVYRGRGCNCQGRIERTRSGALIALALSSAC